MTAPLSRQIPLALEGARKSEVRTQFGALCYRIKNDRIEVLLITSRGSGRWIIPKGWPMPGESAPDAAAAEAWEEAGVKGKVDPRPIGLFSYTKMVDDEEGLPCVVMVYAVKVKSLKTRFPEAGERRRKWVTRKKAAAMVADPELARLVSSFDPRMSH